MDRRGRKRAVDVMLYDSSSNIELDQGNTTTEKTNDPVERHNDTAIDNVQGIVKGVENSCNKCQETQKEMVTLLKELQTEVQQWKEKYNDLKESVSEQEINNKVQTKVSQILQPFFSDTQINIIINNKKSVKYWPDEDIASAMTLRSLSPKCYKYLKDFKGFPLPCVSTLKDRLKEIKCEPGLLSSVLSLMRSQAPTMELKEKLTVLSFDEMSIASRWSYVGEQTKP
ncbi:hypothetical protein Pmani_022898 [Petrolisthes manimaculis]|uniref:THAP9-like helix-turn-helix domain-containing protein n=1 Tax=Petrolisthes manimaculis TaxID=1843537 RepID=A0AAE1PD29_9EUCA|nr:hypothetical protein Pmani_022898 [Petrolisthes manimaculis]